MLNSMMITSWGREAGVSIGISLRNWKLQMELPLGFVGGRLLAIALIIMLTGIVPFWQNSTKR